MIKFKFYMVMTIKIVLKQIQKNTWHLNSKGVIYNQKQGKQTNRKEAQHENSKRKNSRTASNSKLYSR